MDRGRVLSAVALVLAVVALGTVAGGLSTGSVSEGERSPGVGLGSGEGSGVGEGGGIGFNLSGASDLGFPPWLGMGVLVATVWAATLVAGAYVVRFLWGATLRELLDALVRVVGRVAAVAVVMGVLVGVLYLFSALFQSGGGGLGGGSVEAGVQLSGDAQSVSPTLATGVVLLVGAALALLLVVLFVSSRDDEGETTIAISKRSGDETTEGTARPLAADGDVDDPDAANEVYRAWTDVRDRVGPNDRTESPAEVERRAVDAGLDERAVGELTSLFNAVRYGDDGATGERERRARELGATLAGEDGREGDESGNA